MKKLIALALLALSFNTFATVDGYTTVAIVSFDFNSEEFMVTRAPVIGCYGLPRGPQLVQFTAEYHAPSNIGCGGTAATDNINALSCATVTESVESRDYNTFSKIVLDISKCEAKNNPKFITMVRTAAAINFNTPTSKVNLVLKK